MNTPYAITICKKNIKFYRTGTHFNARISWKAGALDASILRNFPRLEHLRCTYNKLETLDELKGCPQLIGLTCHYNCLQSLKGIEHCPRLQKLDCDHNRLTTLKGLEHCPQLRHIKCSGNQLVSLTGIEGCTELIDLNCGINKLTSLLEISSCINLQRLNCSFNQISTLEDIPAGSLISELFIYTNHLTSLAGIDNCALLQCLACSDNRLTSLAELGACRQLLELRCNGNKLVSLAGIEMCSRLNKISCSRNDITSLEPVVYLRNLQSVYYSSNPLDVQSVQVQRRLGMVNRVNTDRSVYDDSQSVHNISIQKCVCESVQRLVRDPKPEFAVEMVIESGMDERAIRLLLEYCDDESIHSVHLLSFKELLSYVWARICRSEHKVELIRILGEQILDAECKCFTGRFNRTLSVLVGFYDDIIIEISDSSRIGAIIVVARDQTVPYSPAEHRRVANNLLIEAGYTDSDIQSWLEAIDD